jgi:uroporphyrinogen-III decarboxylase
MNSKERVAATIRLQEVDYPPMGFYAVDKDTVENVIGHPTYVRNRIGLQKAYWEGRRDEAVDGYKKDLVEFYRKIDCSDVITWREAWTVPPKGFRPEAPKEIGENTWEDRQGRIYRAILETDEIDCVRDPTGTEPEDYRVEDFEGEPDIREPDPSIFEVLDYVIEKLGDRKFIVGPTGGVTCLTLLGGLEKGLMLYALHPEVIEAHNRRSVRVQNALDGFYVRRGVDGLCQSRDLGGTNAPLLSPGMFRQYCYPFFKERIDALRRRFHKPIFHHDCGNTISLMPYLIECGINCYQSLQTTAGMEIGKLKSMFGEKLAFWGGVALELLIRGSREEVRENVRDALRKGGRKGFILGPSQSIAMGTRYDNFMTMIDTYVNERHLF